MDIRQLIKNEMKHRGVTQTSLQKMTGILQHRISEFLTGKRDVTTETLKKLLDALGMEIRRARRPHQKGR